MAMFKDGGYQDFLYRIILILENTKSYNELAHSIFNGLDMYNGVLIDEENDLTSDKENGTKLMRAIMPELKEDDIEKIRSLACEIFVNANKHFTGSRVIQHLISSESRWAYIEWDSEKKELDAQKCKEYLHHLGVAMFDNSIFTENINDIDENVITLVIQQPKTAYAIRKLCYLFKNTYITNETKKQIISNQRLFPNNLSLDYLNEFLPLLLTKGNLSENTIDRLALIREFWMYNSRWCKNTGDKNPPGGGDIYDPDRYSYKWLSETYEPEKTSYNLLKNILNRIMIQTATFDKEGIRALCESVFLEEVHNVSDQPHNIKPLIEAIKAK